MSYKPPFPQNTVSMAVGYTYQGDVVYAGPYLDNRYSGHWNSVKTPGFRTRPKHSLPWNDFSSKFEKVELKDCSFGGMHYPPPYPEYGWDWGVHWAGWKGNLYDSMMSHYWDPSFLAGFPTMDNTSNKAKHALIDRLQSQSINLAQAFAERKQTVNLLTVAVNRIASAALAIRRGNLPHAAKLFGMTLTSGDGLRKLVQPSPRNLSKYWLEYKYGWMPLLSDIYGGAALIAKTYMDKKPDLRQTSTARDTYTKSGRCYHGYAFGYPIESHMDYTIQMESRWVVEYRVDDQVASVMSQTGISNPVNLAWELLPYSFVIDWFVPVGDYLRRLDATNGLTFVRGSRTDKVTDLRDVSLRLVDGVDYNHAPPGTGKLSISGGYIHEKYEKNRSILGSFPSASPPVINTEPINVSRFLSGLSLLTQAFLNRKR